MIGKNPKSLKDTLLECAVYNFPKVFSVYFGDPLIARQFKLPIGLFDELLDKGQELRYRINPKYIKLLMPFRDVLRLTSIALDPALDQISCNSETDGLLDKLSTVEYPMTSLNVCYSDFTENDMLNIQAVSSTIECLEIAYYSRSIKEIFNISFPNLKRLSLRGEEQFPDELNGPLNINLQQFNSLQELVVEHEKVDESFLKQLPFLKNLKVLSLSNTKIDFQNDHICETLGALCNLRTLDLRRQSIYKLDSVTKFSNVLSKLTNLENLDLSHSSLSRNEPIFAPTLQKLKLKKIGLYQQFHTFSDISTFADQTFDLLSYCEMYIKKGDQWIRVGQLIENHIPRDKMNLERIERVVLDSYKNRLISVMKVCNYVTNQNSSEFIMKLINQDINSFDHHHRRAELALYSLAGRCDDLKIFENAQVIRCLLEIIRKNLNKRFVKKLLHILFFAMFHKYNNDPEVDSKLKGQMNCARALKSDIFDEEDKIYFKELQKMFSPDATIDIWDILMRDY